MKNILPVLVGKWARIRWSSTGRTFMMAKIPNKEVRSFGTAKESLTLFPF
jgi:hypothetical protein